MLSIRFVTAVPDRLRPAASARQLLGARCGIALAAALLAAPLAARADTKDAAPAPAAHSGPMLEVQQTTQDGGIVEEGDPIKFEFKVANRGTSDLEIPQVKPSCGCTVPKWDRIIKPGQEGVIDAEVRTIGFRGAILKHLTVITNDPQHAQFELSLTAKVTPLVQITPGPVALLNVDDKPASQVFKLERTGGRPMKILSANPTVPYLKADIKQLPGEGRYQLTATAAADAPMGRSPSPILIKTDMPKGADLTLTLIIDHGIVTTPPMVYWSLPPGELKAPVESAVTLMRQQTPFHVKSVSVDDPKLETSVKTVREGLEYQVTVRYAGGWTADRVQKTLTITTDDAKQPELKIPVLGMTQRPVEFQTVPGGGVVQTVPPGATH
jgi:hypothetical protein